MRRVLVGGARRGQPTQTWTGVDATLGDLMSSYWVNFITRGDPNGRGLPPWPAMTTVGASPVMVLGDAARPEAAVPAPKLDLFDRAYARLLAAPATN